MQPFVVAFLTARGQLDRRDGDEVAASIPEDAGVVPPPESAAGLIWGFVTDLQRMSPRLIQQLRDMVGRRDLSGPGFNCPHCGDPIEISRWDLPEFISAYTWEGRFDHIWS